MIKSFFDLDVINISYGFAMDIFNISRNFPKEEKYSLPNQIVRSSRSVSANIAEGFGKRIYENEFKKHLVYVMGSLEEKKVWRLFSKDCLYISPDIYKAVCKKYDEFGARLYKLFQNWKTF